MLSDILSSTKCQSLQWCHVVQNPLITLKIPTVTENLRLSAWINGSPVIAWWISCCYFVPYVLHIHILIWKWRWQILVLVIFSHLRTTANFNIIIKNDSTNKKCERPYSPQYRLETNIQYELYAKILVELHGWELESLHQSLSLLFYQCSRFQWWEKEVFNISYQLKCHFCFFLFSQECRKKVREFLSMFMHWVTRL